MIVLVVGADRVDAGKTTFTAGLLARTGALGFKPRAGNDYWFDHDDCRRALADGRLYGKDASRIAAAEGRDRAPETLNPVHRLWRPAPGGGTGLLGRSDRQFVLDRIRLPERGGTADRPSAAGVREDGPSATAEVAGTAGGDEVTDTPGGDEVADSASGGEVTDTAGSVEVADSASGDRFVVNATADVPEAVAESLPLSDAIRVDSVEELDRLVERTYLPAFRALERRIATADLAVVESYGDVARPLEGLVPTVVAAVEPGRLRVYRGDRFHRACEVASSSPVDGALEKRVPDVIDGLEPVARRSLPALSTDVRDDPAAIARAYEPAYDAVLRAAQS